ncbi:hypothetical protein ACHQM5_014199 [Ranunculus cassubicifolius]
MRQTAQKRNSKKIHLARKPVQAETQKQTTAAPSSEDSKQVCVMQIANRYLENGIHLLGQIYANDINSARFLWKSIPAGIKEGQPEVVAAWKIGQELWMRKYAGVHEAIRGFNWSPEAKGLVTAFSELYTKKMFQLLCDGYSTICVGDTAIFLGMKEEDATTYALERGWIVDSASGMLTVKKQPVVSEQKLDPSKLQRLTEYVFHLEH